MKRKDNEVKSDKKGFWAMLKESMNKASSGCGPGCGCHVENHDNENQRNNRQDERETDKGQA